MANKRTHPKEWAELLHALNIGDEERAAEIGKIFSDGKRRRRGRGIVFRYRDNTGYISPFMTCKEIAKKIGCSTSSIRNGSQTGVLIKMNYIVEKINIDDYKGIDYNLLPFLNDSRFSYSFFRTINIKTDEVSKWHHREDLAKKLGRTESYLNAAYNNRHIVNKRYYIDRQQLTQGQLVADGGIASD